MKLLSYIALFIAILLALALGSENPQEVSLNLLFVKVQLPLASLLYITFLFGAAIAALIGFLRKLKTKPNA